MRHLRTVLAVIVLCGVGQAQGQMDRFTRYVAADFQGDGRAEIVAAGNSSHGESRVWVGMPGARSFRPLAGVLPSPRIRDVAATDYDLDGKLDLITVGDGALRAYQVDGAEARLISEAPLGTDWTDRVTTYGGGEDLMCVVTEYSIFPDQDVGTTTLRGFEVRSQTFSEIWTFSIRSHVGDLALVGGTAGPVLILETGTGDEGGDVLVYDVSEAPVPTWSGRISDGSRCLLVQTVDGERSRVLFQSIDRQSHVYAVVGGELRYDHTRIVRNPLVHVVGLAGHAVSELSEAAIITLRPLIR